MKKIILLLLAVLLCLSGCGKNLDHIPSLKLIRENDIQWAREKLEGYTSQNLREIWQEPTALPGVDGEAWQLPGEGDYLVVSYENGKAAEVRFVSVMTATILETDGQAILVEPVEGEWELRSSDRISVGISELSQETRTALEAGITVRIYYDGMIRETYPAQAGDAFGIEICE